MTEFTINTAVLEQLANSTPQTLSRWLGDVADQMLDDIKASMNTSPPGRIYDREGGRVHVASQPGYPPNTDTEDLINSLKVVDVAPLSKRIEDGVEHGVYMELGTETIEARPFMTPVFEEWADHKLEDDAKQAGLFDG